MVVRREGGDDRVWDPSPVDAVGKGLDWHHQDACMAASTHNCCEKQFLGNAVVDFAAADTRRKGPLPLKRVSSFSANTRSA